MARPHRKAGVLVDFQPMSPDEIEQTMQFLIRQQAQFAADSEKLSLKLDRMTEGIVGLAGIVGHVVEGGGELSERVDQLVETAGYLVGTVGQLAEAQRRTDEQFKRTDSRLDELGEYIKTVESHLNILVETFERHLREDHGRRPS